MILGIGNDIVNITRIERLLNIYGDKFLDKIYTKTEQSRADVSDKSARVAILARRFAAKEAMAKALGTGFGKHVRFHDISVKNMRNGRPTIALSGEAAKQLEKLTPKGYEPKIELSLSDDYPMAQAFIIISAIKKKGKQNGQVTTKDQEKETSESQG